MYEKYLEEIKTREKAATPGPWKHEYTTDGAYVHDGDAIICRCTQLGDEASFIAHARTDIPALLAEVERLNIVLQDERKQHAGEYARMRSTYLDAAAVKDQQISTLKKALKSVSYELAKETSITNYDSAVKRLAKGIYNKAVEQEQEQEANA